MIIMCNDLMIYNIYFSNNIAESDYLRKMQLMINPVENKPSITVTSFLLFLNPARS